MVRYEIDSGFCEFGEMKNKELHGRGIYFNLSDGDIYIRYYHYGRRTFGNWIIIWRNGKVSVGERDFKDKYTNYDLDGTVNYSDYDAPAMGSFENLNTEFDDFKDDLVLEEEVNHKQNRCRLF